MAYKLSDTIPYCSVKYLDVNLTGDVTGSGTVDLTQSMDNWITKKATLNITTSGGGGDEVVVPPHSIYKYAKIGSELTATIPHATSLTMTNSQGLGTPLTVTNPNDYSLLTYILVVGRTGVMGASPSDLIENSTVLGLAVNNAMSHNDGWSVLANESRCFSLPYEFPPNSTNTVQLRGARNNSSFDQGVYFSIMVII